MFILAKHTPTHQIIIQFHNYNLYVILGGKNCIVSLPIFNFNIVSFGIRYTNCDMSNSVSYKIHEGIRKYIKYSEVFGKTNISKNFLSYKY